MMPQKLSLTLNRKMMRYLQLIFFLGLLSSAQGQVNYHVTSLDDHHPDSLMGATFRWAIQESNASFFGTDTITFDTSFSSFDTIFLSHYDVGDLMLNISRPVVIDGEGVVIFAAVPGAIVQVSQESKIENLQFVNANTDRVGGAMLCNSFSGPIELYNCQFKNNQSIASGNQGRGAAIMQIRGETIIENCHFENNVGNLGIGGAIATEGFYEGVNFLITLRNSTFVNNGPGAAVFIGCHVDLFLRDGSAEDVILTTGCENFGLVSGSINLEDQFTLITGVTIEVFLQSLF